MSIRRTVRCICFALIISSLPFPLAAEDFTNAIRAYLQHRAEFEKKPGGIVVYNEAELPQGCARPDVRMIAADFTKLADKLGSAKATNMAMLGALLEAGDVLDEGIIAAAIKQRVKNQRWFDLDMAAIAAGRQQARADVTA